MPQPDSVVSPKSLVDSARTWILGPEDDFTTPGCDADNARYRIDGIVTKAINTKDPRSGSDRATARDFRRALIVMAAAFALLIASLIITALRHVVILSIATTDVIGVLLIGMCAVLAVRVGWRTAISWHAVPWPSTLSHRFDAIDDLAADKLENESEDDLEAAYADWRKEKIRFTAAVTLFGFAPAVFVTAAVAHVLPITLPFVFKSWASFVDYGPMYLLGMLILTLPAAFAHERRMKIERGVSIVERALNRVRRKPR